MSEYHCILFGFAVGTLAFSLMVGVPIAEAFAERRKRREL